MQTLSLVLGTIAHTLATFFVWDFLVVHNVSVPFFTFMSLLGAAAVFSVQVRPWTRRKPLSQIQVR